MFPVIHYSRYSQHVLLVTFSLSLSLDFICVCAFNVTFCLYSNAGLFLSFSISVSTLLG